MEMWYFSILVCPLPIAGFLAGRKVPQCVLLPHTDKIQNKMLFFVTAPNEQILDRKYKIKELKNAVVN